MISHLLHLPAGSAEPLGPSKQGDTTNFAVHSGGASSMQLVLMNPEDRSREEIPMNKSGGWDTAGVSNVWVCACAAWGGGCACRALGAVQAQRGKGCAGEGGLCGVRRGKGCAVGGGALRA
jgi:hypothetical protein